MTTRFLQLHTLTSYPAALLNRDDAGFAKRMPFGGGIRTRISSQCLKRHWRTYKGDHDFASLKVPESIRSRETFGRLVLPRVIEAGILENRAKWSVASLVALLQGGTSSGAKSKQKRKSIAKKFIGIPDEPANTKKKTRDQPRDNDAIVEDSDVDALKQIVVLGPAEVEYLTKEAIELSRSNSIKDEELVEFARERAVGVQTKNLEALESSISKGAGMSAALFGRMRTGDLFAETNAAIHVAHAMTVHAQMTESDYFSAIDDLIREDGEQASGHINASELTSGLFYGYIVVDVDLLVKNLGDDRILASDVVHRLVHIVSTVSPGAKLGSTAPYAYSHLVLAESSKAQPRTLQNAFLEPVKTDGNVIHNAYSAVEKHLAELDSMYGKNEQRAHAGLDTIKKLSGRDDLIERFENKMSLTKLADWAKARVLA